LVIGLSTPYRRGGLLYNKWRDHFGVSDNAVLCVSGPSLTFNPTLDRGVIAAAMASDPEAARSEWEASFRTDIESYIAREAVEACVDPEVRERGALSTLRYRAFIDPSGGSSDSMTLAIGHREGNLAVLDCVREAKPPFSPAGVAAEFAQVLKSYRVSKVVGDHYGGEWPREAFKAHGIGYEAAAKPKSDLYRDLLAVINSRQAALLDHSKLIAQLVGLERRTARSGRDAIDHAPNAHDDVANAVAGVLVELSTKAAGYDLTGRWIDGVPIGATAAAKAEAEAYHRRLFASYVMSGGYTRPVRPY
jgi:hypothetical protein